MASYKHNECLIALAHPATSPCLAQKRVRAEKHLATHQDECAFIQHGLWQFLSFSGGVGAKKESCWAAIETINYDQRPLDKGARHWQLHEAAWQGKKSCFCFGSPDTHQPARSSSQTHLLGPIAMIVKLDLSFDIALERMLTVMNYRPRTILCLTPPGLL